MPDTGYFGLTYELLFEGDGAWTDITPLVDSRTTKVDIAGCSDDLKSVIGKCSFEIRYGTNPKMVEHSILVGKLLSAKAALQTVRFRMGGAFDFVGKVDLGNFSQKNGRIPGFLTVDCEDNSYLLDEKMPASFEYPVSDDLADEGYAVFDKANLAQSIVMLRFLDAGYTVDQIDTTNSDSITEKVRRVVYDADDERTYRDFIDTMLYEYCAVLYTTPEGKLSVRRLYKEAPASERSLEHFLVKDGIETSGGDYQFDGVRVKWSNLATLLGAVVYNANITLELDDEGNQVGEEIQPQHYWPENGDIEETWQEFNATFLDREYQTKVSRLKNKDLSLISVKNAYYEVDKDAEILLANNPPDITPTKARVLWWNSHSSEVRKLYGFTIVGDALFRNKINESTYPVDARKMDDAYESEFVYSSTVAQALANHLHRFRKYGDLQHKWSEIGVETPMFQVVTVSAPDTLISSMAMVISQSITFPAPNKVKRANSAIGITAFNSEPVRTRSVQIGGAPVNTGPAGSSGTRSVVQFILGTADAPYSETGSVVGTSLGRVGTSLALVGVEGASWSYEAPVPDAGEYVWRREGYYTPPELWPKVWNITRMTGASSFGITLHPSALSIPVTSRGVPYGSDITVNAVFQNIPDTYTITWGITGASFVDAGTNQTKVVDVSTITADAVIITVSVLFGGVTYTDMVTLNKVADGKPAPVNLGGVTVVPTDVGGEPLVAGDYFLWAGTTGTYTKGKIYEWSGSAWVESTNGDLVMTMFDSFADLANDVDSTVIGNAVIKKLVSIEAFVENLKARMLEVVDGTYSVKVNKTDGIKQVNDGITVFHAKPDGDMMLGNYNPSTKTGGIYYDKSEDKLLGNVAYDQWDLVIESDADLALLTSGSTTYENVLIAPGTWNVNAPIELRSHGVKRFVGTGESQSIINLQYVVSSTTNKRAIDCGTISNTLIEMGGFSITTDTTQSGTYHVISLPSLEYINIHDITISGSSFSGTGYGIGSYSSSYCRTVSRCKLVNLAIGLYYIHSVSDCYFADCGIGAYYCYDVSNCYADGNASTGTGFNRCYNVSTCEAISTDIGFAICYRVTGCSASYNNYGFATCGYISASYAISNTINWSSNTNVDFDSTNCDETRNLTASTIDTGQGATEVYKETYEAVTTDSYSNTPYGARSVTLSSMAVGETKRIKWSNRPREGATNTINLPSGGTYAVYGNDTPILSGGSALITETGTSGTNNVWQYSGIVIWRVS